MQKKLGAAKKLRVYDGKAVQEYHNQGHRMSACRSEFGFSKDAWDKAVRRGEIIHHPWKIPLETLLVEARGTNTSRKHLKGRLWRVGLMNDCCHECGLQEWRGQSLPLELHHVNGVPNDKD